MASGSFKQAHTKSKAKDNVAVNTETGGTLATTVPVVQAELVDPKKSALENGFSLVEKAAGLVAKFTTQAETSIEKVEQDLTALMSGEMTVEGLAAKYGTMSFKDADAAKAQLSMVLNAMEVAIKTEQTKQVGIQVEKERAFTALGGLEAAFQVQARTEQVADARDEALYQGDVHDANNQRRNDDIEYREQYNQIQKAENDDKIAHKGQMFQFGQAIREAVRRGAASALELKQEQVNSRVTAAQRIMGKIQTDGKGGKTRGQ